MEAGRAAGCLVGLAVGDALGFPLEGMSARRIARRFGRPERYRFLGRRGFVSDDTEQAVMAAEAALACRRSAGGEPAVDPEQAARRFARRLVGWFWTIPPGVGLATLRACLKLSVGLRGGVLSAGNGAAMRAAPLGLLPLGPVERRALVEAISRVTHVDPRAVDGARAVAEGVALLGEDPGAGWPALRDRLPDLDGRLAERLERAWELRGAAPEEAARELGITGFVLHSVPLAFWAAWSGPADFLEGLHRVVLLGGDTDSTGAMAGALLGVRFGLAGIPSELAGNLEGCYSAPRLEALARALARGGPPPGHPGFWALRSREAAIKLGVGLHVLGRMIP